MEQNRTNVCHFTVSLYDISFENMGNPKNDYLHNHNKQALGNTDH